MTEQECVEVFKELLDVPCEMLIEYDSVTTGEQKKALVKIRVAEDMAIKALEKQIAKKPFKTMDENNPYYKYMPWCCPCCRETLYEDAEWGEQEFAYCTDCGQKLDWGNE